MFLNKQNSFAMSNSTSLFFFFLSIFYYFSQDSNFICSKKNLNFEIMSRKLEYPIKITGSINAYFLTISFHQKLYEAPP